LIDLRYSKISLVVILTQPRFPSPSVIETAERGRKICSNYAAGEISHGHQYKIARHCRPDYAAAGGDHSAAASRPCRDNGAAMTAQIVIRPLRLDERMAWEPLWKGYLDFYRFTAPQETYDATWARLHDPNEPMWLLGGYVDGKLLGIVHYIYHRSCWTIGDYCYLQDLFVAEGARKLGLGRALIEAVYAAARAAGASRVHWLTYETNAVARSLYDTLADRPGFIQYRKLF